MVSRESGERIPNAAVISAAIACCLTVIRAPDSLASTLPPVPQGGSIRFVQNCNDSGPGSLRDTVAQAVSGDSIDLAQMQCSLISLSTGAIEVPQDDLTIKYSTEAGHPTISGEYLDRVFHHTGAGTLELGNLTVEQGKYAPTDIDQLGEYGGCIYSRGNVTLSSSVLTRCDLKSEIAYGAGLYAHGVATIYNSEVSYCHIQTITHPIIGLSYGAGLHSRVAHISYSTIAHNVVDWPGGGAGFASRNTYPTIAEPLTVDHALIAYNHAYNNAAALINNYWQGIVFSDVTIVGNSATGNSYTGTNGGIYIKDGGNLQNVTLAGNQSNASPSALWVYSVTMTNTIVAGNTTPFSDSHQLRGSIGGDHNVVFGPAGEAIPSDTLLVDPLLLPLADNGGKTRTMALRFDSPALDAGVANDSLATDQRGNGFPRLVGTAVDIGAFERQGPNDGDYISVGGFDPP